MVRNSGGGVVFGEKEGGNKKDAIHFDNLTTTECDSTTSAVVIEQHFKKGKNPGSSQVIQNHHHQQFEIDEDVYYMEMEGSGSGGGGGGKNVLGTVELIQGKKLKIKFMDGTEKWAPVSRVKKITVSFRDEDDEEEDDRMSEQIIQPPPRVDTSSIAALCSGKVVVGKKAKKGMEIGGGGGCKEREVTCGSCGTQKMITSKKAVDYSPYNCRKCINKSKTSKNNNGVPIIAAAHYLAAAAARGRPRSNNNNNNNNTNDMMMLMMGHSHHQTSSSSSSIQSNKAVNNNATTTIMMLDSSGGRSGSSHHHHHSTSGDCDVIVCLHCRTQIVEKVSLHCTMCERPCHPSCLALTPAPMAGDIFWSIICHVCGTQKPTTLDDNTGLAENDSQKLYSSRRSITCWSDVAYLLLSCMGCRHPNERFFDLDEQVIPFWEENLSRLHLPRQYKQADPSERRRSLLVALNNANLRFTKDERNNNKSSPLLSSSPPSTPLFAIKDRCLNVLIKQQQQQQSSRAVTAAGFPIQIRANNLETTSVVMSNIAQTIAVQAAANKSVPSPKNSPVGDRGVKMADCPQKPVRPIPVQQLRKKEQIAKKSGSEVNSGAQRKGDGMMGSYNKPSSSKFDLPESSTVVKQKAVLTPSPGGAARCMVVQSPCDNNSGRSGGSIGSFPVRKNGSPVILERVGKVVKVEGKGESSGVKRKLSYPPEDPTPSSPSQQPTTTSKKLKLMTHLPASTDVTPKRVISNDPAISPTIITPSPPPPLTKSSSSPCTKKSSMSPLQKLSDLQRNGGLTVACLTQRDDGGYSSASLEGGSSVFGDRDEVERVVVTRDEGEIVTKSCAEVSVVVPPPPEVVSLVSPERLKRFSSAIATNSRPVRLKRSVVAAKAEKKKVEERVKLLNKSRAVLAGKGISTTSSTSSSSPLILKGRGRAKGKEEEARVVEQVVEESEDGRVEFSWGSATVADLLRFGVGVTIGVLPRGGAEVGVKHFSDEVVGVVRAPSYWDNSSSSSSRSRGGLRRDLKDLESYVVCGRRVVGGGGVQYQVVWGCCGDDDDDEEERVSNSKGSDDDDGFFRFEDYDHLEYFMDRMPVVDDGRERVFVEEEQERAVVKEEEEEGVVHHRVRNVVIDVVDLTDSP